MERIACSLVDMLAQRGLMPIRRKYRGASVFPQPVTLQGDVQIFYLDSQDFFMRIRRTMFGALRGFA